LIEAQAMKRTAWLLVIVGFVAACQQGSSEPADSYRRWSDRAIARLSLERFGIWPCPPREKVEFGAKVFVGRPTDECFRMQPQQRWRGLWRNEFEGSRFCPAPAKQCEFDTPGDIIWLDAERVRKTEPDGALYAVDLLGRRTSVEGHYGHMGGSDHELIVDRFISIAKLGPPLTRAQIEAELQQCRKGKRCSSWGS
jgi:hypothetical protein